MPIRADLLHHYRTPAWREARDRVLARAGNRCEACGLLNGLRGWRDRDGRFHRAHGRNWRKRCGARRVILVQIGVAHLNHVSGDDRDENLRALCRRCHLLYDAPHHRETRAARKDAERPILAMLAEVA